MDTFLPLIPVFVLGAMSPGPSLAVVVHNSIAGGRRQGVLTAIGHGIGFGIYAFVATFGLASIVTSSDAAAEFVKWAGVALLLYLAFMYFRAATRDTGEKSGHPSPRTSGRTGFWQGFLIAFLNPNTVAQLFDALATHAPILPHNPLILLS